MGERQSSPRILPFTRARAVCGTMSPTNPMSPVKETAAAAEAAAAIRLMSRTRLTGTPKEPASVSPRQKSASFLESSWLATRQARMRTAGKRRSSVFTPCSPPTEKSM